GDAARLPIAGALFRLGDINAVYVQDDYVSVNAGEWADWDEIERVARTHLPMFDADEASRLAGEAAQAAEQAKAAAEPNDKLDEINAIIDKFVRPALAADGGGLDIVSLEDNILKVRYQGACGGCPSAVMGTLRAIEGLLRQQLDEPDLTLVAD